MPFPSFLPGVLEAFDRDEVQDYIKRYGGKVTSAVSGKTSYLIVGREPGESKITKAEKVGTKKLDEDGFLEMCESKAPKGGKSSPAKFQSESPKVDVKTPKSGKSSKTESPKPQAKSSKIEDGKAVLDRLKGVKSSPSSTKSSPSFSQSSQMSQSSQKSSSTPNTQSPVVTRPTTPGCSLLWVDKYKPKSMKQIVGQQGDKSNANKLKKWLINWKKNFGPGSARKKGGFNAGIFPYP